MTFTDEDGVVTLRDEIDGELWVIELRTEGVARRVTWLRDGQVVDRLTIDVGQERLWAKLLHRAATMINVKAKR